MNKNNNKIITDQRLFFNLNANKKSKNPYLNKLFTQYANQIQTVAFTWLKNSKTILDYGCGTGPSIDLFLGNKNPGNYQIVGVDIAENSIKQARKKYPLYKFYTIRNNKVPQVKNNSIDAVIMAHILHHFSCCSCAFWSTRTHLDSDFCMDTLSSSFFKDVF